MKVLIVVDMQHDFVYGSLGTPEAASIVENVKDKVARCNACGYSIIYTKDTHTNCYLSTREGKNLPVEHCIKGTPGWEFVDGVYIPGSPVVEKPAFGSLELPSLISSCISSDGESCPGSDTDNGNNSSCNDGNHGIDEIELVGLCTDICVLSNAIILKASYPEVKVSVDSSCCAGVTPESHSRALEAMKMCQIEVV